MECSDNTATVTIPVGEGWRRYDAELELYEHIKNDILQDAEAAGMSPQQGFKLELGIEEIAVNIIKYAYKDPGYMFIRTDSDGGQFRLEFVDHGLPFDPLVQKMKHGEVPTDDQDEGGYGIFLVKKNFSSVVYRHEEMFDGMANHLIMELPLS